MFYSNCHFSHSLLKKQKIEVSLYLEICYNVEVLLQFFTQDYILLKSLSWPSRILFANSVTVGWKCCLSFRSSVYAQYSPPANNGFLWNGLYAAAFFCMPFSDAVFRQWNQVGTEATAVQLPLLFPSPSTPSWEIPSSSCSWNRTQQQISGQPWYHEKLSGLHGWFIIQTHIPFFSLKVTFSSPWGWGMGCEFVNYLLL